MNEVDELAALRREHDEIVSLLTEQAANYRKAAADVDAILASLKGDTGKVRDLREGDFFRFRTSGGTHAVLSVDRDPEDPTRRIVRHTTGRDVQTTNLANDHQILWVARAAAVAS